MIARRPATLTELPLSAHQQSWWSLCARYPHALAPLVFVGHRLRGPLVVDAWVRAVGTLVDRHESLRIRFVTRAGAPAQVIDPPIGLDVEFIDLSDLPEAAREDRARELLNERRRVQFDLERDRLVASCLLRLAEDDHVWTLTIHHILADGASVAIIDRELGASYRAFVADTEPAPAELPIEYGDYLVWHAAESEPQHDDDRRYWWERLAGVPMLELRADLPRPERRGAPAAYVRHLIAGDLPARVAELGRAERCTRYMVLVAALQILLGQYSGQRDFCFGIPVAGRTVAELAPLVGLLSNLLTLRCDLSGDPTFRELLASTRDSVLDALDHQDLPFAQVVPYLNAAPDQVFQVLFDYDDFDEDGGLELAGVRVEEFPLAIPKTLHDIVISAWPTKAGLWTRFVYDSALFSASMMDTMAIEYERILRAAVADPEVRVATLTADRE